MQPRIGRSRLSPFHEGERSGITGRRSARPLGTTPISHRGFDRFTRHYHPARSATRDGTFGHLFGGSPSPISRSGIGLRRARESVGAVRQLVFGVIVRGPHTLRMPQVFENVNAPSAEFGRWHPELLTAAADAKNRKISKLFYYDHRVQPQPGRSLGPAGFSKTRLHWLAPTASCGPSGGAFSSGRIG
jgi:hypothetical protein